jgi:UDP-glucose 4-epimerase
VLERASLGVSRRSLFATLSLLVMLCALAIPAIARAEGFGDDTPTGLSGKSSRHHARRHRNRELRANERDDQAVSIQELEGSAALVTGASGFLGSQLSSRLVEAGADVSAVARSTPRHTDDADWWSADLTEPGAASALFRATKPDLVFHLASHVNGSRGLDAVLPTLSANLVSTINVLLAAAESGTQRVVLAGSLEEPDPSLDPAVPVSPYAASKFAASAYARMFHDLHGVPVAIVRIGMAYGPGQRDRTKLVPHVITSLLRNEAPAIASGARLADWVYVDDVVDAFLLAATRDEAVGETVEVGSGELTAVRDVVELIARLMRTSVRPQFGALPDRPNERRRSADVERAKAVLGWGPRTSLETGLASTIASFSNGAAPSTATIHPSRGVAQPG